MEAEQSESFSVVLKEEDEWNQEAQQVVLHVPQCSTFDVPSVLVSLHCL